MSIGPTLTINRTTREVTLTRSPLGLQGLQGDPGLGNIRVVTIESGNYTLLTTDSVVVFTATATATLPAATGSGLTYRIVCRAGTLTVDADGTETVKGAATAVLNAGEDLIITDTAAGVWE